MDKITRVEENLTAIDEIIGDERIRDSVREILLKEKEFYKDTTKDETNKRDEYK